MSNQSKFSLIILAALICTACNAPVPPLAEAATLTATAIVMATSTLTSVPTKTATMQPPTPTDTATPLPSPTLTPTPQAELRQLTTGGCCAQPFFSADSHQVLFIDKPNEDAPTGIYGVEVAQPQPNPTLVSEMIGFYNHDRSLVATIEGADLLRLTRVATGENWTMNTKGNWPKFSPDGKLVLWTARDEEGPYDQRAGDVWVANLDGSQARQLFTTYGGGFGDWLADSQRFLLVSKPKPNVIEVTLSVYDITKNSQIDLFTERQLRQVKLSTGGSWVVFYAMFAEDATRSGLWLLSTDGQSQRQLAVPHFGAYQWQDDDTLLYLPMRAAGETSMQLWAIDAATARLTPLTDPQQLPFVVANGDWKVSPDGRHVAFVNSADNNIWLIDLP